MKEMVKLYFGLLKIHVKFIKRVHSPPPPPLPANLMCGLILLTITTLIHTIFYSHILYLYTIKKHVNLIRKYHNHTLQTNPRYREEESQNTRCHKTSGRQLFLSKATISLSLSLSLPHQDDCKTRKTQSTE